MVIPSIVSPGTPGRIACCSVAYTARTSQTPGAQTPRRRRAALRSQPSWNAHATAIMTNDETFSFASSGEVAGPMWEENPSPFRFLRSSPLESFPGEREAGERAERRAFFFDLHAMLGAKARQSVVVSCAVDDHRYVLGKLTGSPSCARSVVLINVLFTCSLMLRSA